MSWCLKNTTLTPPSPPTAQRKTLIDNSISIIPSYPFDDTEKSVRIKIFTLTHQYFLAFRTRSIKLCCYLSFRSYLYADEEGVHPEVQFVFDLELPRSFEPQSNDKEVSDFYLLPIKEVHFNINLTDILMKGVPLICEQINLPPSPSLLRILPNSHRNGFNDSEHWQ